MAGDASKAKANTVAIQAALDTKHLVIPAGDWFFDSKLVIPRFGFVAGVGDLSRLIFTGTGVAIESEPRGIFLARDFALYSEIGGATVGLLLVNPQYSTLNRVCVSGHNHRPWSISGIEIVSDNQAPGWNAAGIHLVDCRVQECGGDGLRIREDTARTNVSGGRYHWNKGFGINCPTTTGKISTVQIRDAVTEGNIAGQINADCLWASVIEAVHLENSVGQTSIPLVLGKAGACKGVSVRNCNINGQSAPYCIDANAQGMNYGLEIVGNTLSAVAPLAYIRLKAIGAELAHNIRYADVDLLSVVAGSSNIKVFEQAT